MWLLQNRLEKFSILVCPPDSTVTLAQPAATLFKATAHAASLPNTQPRRRLLQTTRILQVTALVATTHPCNSLATHPWKQRPIDTPASPVAASGFPGTLSPPHPPASVPFALPSSGLAPSAVSYKFQPHDKFRATTASAEVNASLLTPAAS
jgi:hypothetical protein